MSLILDALRKSDVERSRNQAPQVAGAPAPATPERGRRLLLPVALLLTINIGLLVWVLTMRAAPEPRERVIEAVPMDTVGGADVPPQRPSARDLQARPAPRADDRIASRPPPKAAVSSLLEAASPRADAAAPRTNAAAASSPAGDQAALPARALAELSSADELVADGVTSEETLAVQLHVYSDSPGSRFAFVGGSRREEGEAIGDGIRIVEIIRDGIILEYAGRQYLLARE